MATDTNKVARKCGRLTFTVADVACLIRKVTPLRSDESTSVRTITFAVAAVALLL